MANLEPSAQFWPPPGSSLISALLLRVPPCHLSPAPRPWPSAGPECSPPQGPGLSTMLPVPWWPSLYTKSAGLCILEPFSSAPRRGPSWCPVPGCLDRGSVPCPSPQSNCTCFLVLGGLRLAQLWTSVLAATHLLSSQSTFPSSSLSLALDPHRGLSQECHLKAPLSLRCCCPPGHSVTGPCLYR